MDLKMDRRSTNRQCCCYYNKLYRASIRTTVPTYTILLALISLFHVLGVATAQTDTEDTRAVLIDPYRMSLPLGAEGFVNCSMDETTLQEGENVTAITWYTEGEEELGKKNLTGFGYTLGEDGSSIVFRNVQEADSQTFRCEVTLQIFPVANSSETTAYYNGTFEYKVYEMPTYLVPGLIILGINVGLLIIFLACLARSMVADKKRLQKYAKTN